MPGAGRLLAGSIESPEPISSFNRELALAQPPFAVLRLPVDTVVFLFFLDASANLGCLRKAGETCREEMNFIKANSSSLSMTPR